MRERGTASLAVARAGAKTLDQTDVTGPDGTFRVEGVPAPGVYRVVCSVGSVVEKGPEVTLTRGGEVATADVTLRLRMSEQVSVTAEAWTLPKDVPNSVAIKTAEKLATLYDQGIVPQDRMSVEAALANYQTGKVPFIAVLEALMTLYNDRATHLRLLADHELTLASLEEASLDSTSGMERAGVAAAGGRPGGAAPGATGSSMNGSGMGSR